MKQFLLQIFTWWNGQTIGTRFFTWRKGIRVGDDEAGNIYYRDGADAHRWVIYNGVAEPTTVPPEWHGWLHRTVDVPPSESDYQPRAWQKPNRPNATGTPGAYRPRGSILTPETRPRATGDYDAWTPGN